jgi:hypothetical protein
LQFFALKNLYLHRQKEILLYYGPVAQRIEQLISNQLAAGSIPAGVTESVVMCLKSTLYDGNFIPYTSPRHELVHAPFRTNRGFQTG